MADSTAKLEECKAAASKCRSQIQTAATKHEALGLAINAAEQLMKAFKMTSDPNEKKWLKAQCAELMDMADRIKNMPNWAPANMPTKTDKNEQIGKWAADVAVTTDSTRTPENTMFQSSVSNQSVSPTTVPAHTHIRSGTSPGSPAALAIRSADAHKSAHTPLQPHIDHPENRLSPSHGNTPAGDQHNGSIRVEDHRGNGTTASLGTAAHQSPSQLAPVSSLQEGKSTTRGAVPSLSTASASHIHRLREPISTRKRAKKEEIILLKASRINGSKCPPWSQDPATTDFVPQQGDALFTDTHDLSLSQYQHQFFQGWVRAHDAVPPPSLRTEDERNTRPLMSSPYPTDLVQDVASDCSVVASLCAGVARADRGHDELLQNKLYPNDKQLKRPVTSLNGKYIARLNFNGCWRKVIFDDRLPASSTHRLLHVTDRRNPALLWPALLEKAYLKIRGGYDFPGSNSCSDLWTLTGWIPEQVFLQETDTIPGQLWGRIYKAFLYGDVLITAGTGKMSTRQEREFGLEGQHSYAVLDMKEIGDDRILLIKNPWVEGKGWCGPRPPAVSAFDSLALNKEPKDGLEAYHRDSVPTNDRPHPTTFWIGLEQVIQHFESLYLNWNPGLFRHRQDIHFEWTVGSRQSPGRCIVGHPQFAFQSGNAGSVWFLLSRHFQDTPNDTKDDESVFPDSQVNSSGDAPMGYMSMYVCNGHGERLYIKDTYLESSDYVTTPQCLLRWEADANSTYTVVVEQDNLPPSPYTFTLSAFSNSDSGIKLEPAIHRYPVQKVERGSWTRHTAGGSVSSSRYFENPQYALEVHERGSLAILLTSTDHEHPLHVKLVLGHGKRIFRLQSRDVLVDSGDHGSGCVFAEIHDLQPGQYTVICSLFEAGQTGDYSLSIDSTSEVGLKAIPRDGAGLLSTKLASACFGPDIHKIAAPIVPHRLASYTIIARFLGATSPRSVDMGMLARSPLRLSVELGRGPERKFVIASERGEYADSATVRSESVNIDPIVAKHCDMWLVLDRLSGPGGPVEEWYEVEIYTDMPQACTVGVWRDWSD